MYNIGIDGVSCTIVLNKQVQDSFRIDKNLKNSDGTIYGSVKSFGENIRLRFNVPLMIRENNLIPFGRDDLKHVDYIKEKLSNDLKNILGDKIKEIKPNAIEVNVTKQLQYAKVSDVLKLIKLAYLDKVKQTASWELQSDNMYEIRNVGMLSYLLVNEYRLKCYDKTEQLKNKMENDLDIENVNEKWEINKSGNLEEEWKNKEGVENQRSGKLKEWEIKRSGSLTIPENVLRIEMIMQGRRIRLTYGRKCQLFDVLDNLPKLFDLFVYKYENEFLKRIMNYLSKLKNAMFEELTQGIKSDEVISKYIHILVDSKQVEMMFKRYCQFKGYPNQSVEQTKRVAKKYNLGTGCIRELKYMIEKLPSEI